MIDEISASNKNIVWMRCKKEEEEMGFIPLPVGFIVMIVGLI